ncbi:MAG: sensor histidine kinase [Planctomycetota bacterium]
MTRIIAKQRSLHKDLAHQQEQNHSLKCQIGQLQALANIGVNTSMIAHEINNLLTPLGSYAALALGNPDDKGLTEKALRKTAQNCGRATKIMQSILAVADGETQEKQNTALTDLVEEIFNCLGRDFTKDGITVDVRIDDDLTVWMVPVEIQQVLMNLILNARDAMLPQGGVLTIEATETSDTVQIEVRDSGCGIEPADLERIFEPFFTTKKSKKSDKETSGSGLGLAFCKKIIESHEGCISVESDPDRGTIFTITLPKRQ